MRMYLIGWLTSATDGEALFMVSAGAVFVLMLVLLAWAEGQGRGWRKAAPYWEGVGFHKGADAVRLEAHQRALGPSVTLFGEPLQGEA